MCQKKQVQESLRLLVDCKRGLLLPLYSITVTFFLGDDHDVFAVWFFFFFFFVHFDMSRVSSCVTGVDSSHYHKTVPVSKIQHKYYVCLLIFLTQVIYISFVSLKNLRYLSSL